jgi:hypothetical protein
MKTKGILNDAIGIASLSLVAPAGKMLSDSLKMKPKKNVVKRQTKRLIKGSVDLMVGTALLGSI